MSLLCCRAILRITLMFQSFLRLYFLYPVMGSPVCQNQCGLRFLDMLPQQVWRSIAYLPLNICVLRTLAYLICLLFWKHGIVQMQIQIQHGHRICFCVLSENNQQNVPILEDLLRHNTSRPHIDQPFLAPTHPHYTSRCHCGIITAGRKLKGRLASDGAVVAGFIMKFAEKTLAEKPLTTDTLTV